MEQYLVAYTYKSKFNSEHSQRSTILSKKEIQPADSWPYTAERTIKTLKTIVEEKTEDEVVDILAITALHKMFYFHEKD